MFAGAFLDDHDPAPATNLDVLCALDGQAFTIEVTVADVGSDVTLDALSPIVVYADPADYCDLR